MQPPTQTVGAPSLGPQMATGPQASAAASAMDAPPGLNTSDPAGDHAPGFLRIGRRGIGLQARAMRLREGDVLVGVNGAPFTDGAAGLAARFEALEELEEDPTPQLLLTFWRDGVFFHQLHAVMPRFEAEICEPDRAVEIAAGFARLQIAPPQRYENYEVFRDIKRVCGMHSTTPDPLAFIAPVMWMLNHRLVYPLVAILIVYAITFLTHWAMFVVAYGLTSVYARRAQLNLLRSYQMFSDRFFWVVLAETDEIRARAVCRQFDAEVIFPSDPAPKPSKRKRKAPQSANRSARPV